MIFHCDACGQKSVVMAFTGEHACPWCGHSQTLQVMGKPMPRGLHRRTKRS